MKKRVLWKKLSAVGLSLIMASSMMACGGNTDSATTAGGESLSAAQTEGTTNSEKPVSEGDPVEISIAIWDADKAFAGEAVLESIEQKLNIKITPMQVTWDDYLQKVQLWASSGSLPDVFIGDFRNTTFYPQWANQGVIKAIPENLDAYPTLKEYLSGQASQDAKLHGNLYCIPRQTYPSQEWTTLDRVIAYRWDLAQDAGITKEPETWKEFQDMMSAIMAKDADGTGIAGMTGMPLLLTGAFLPYASSLSAEGGGGAGFRWVKDEDGLFKPAYFTGDTVKALQLARDMYNSGVIEKDIALNKGTAAEDKFLQGKSAAILVAGGYSNLYANVGRYWKEIHGSEFTDDVKALNLMPDVNGNKSYPAWGYAWSESYINANVSDEKLDKILQLFDYLLTDEGAFLSNYGPEGEFYDMVDGKVQLHDSSVVITDTYPSLGALGVLARWSPSAYDERFVSAVPEEYVGVNNQLVEQATDVVVPDYDEQSSALMLEKEIDFKINFQDDFLSIMTGTEDVEKMWDELYKQYEANGLNDAITQINEAHTAE